MLNRPKSGFSLVELLIAVLVAAVLIHGVFRLQNHTLNLAVHSRFAWDSINLVQKLMAEKGPGGLAADSGSLASPPGREENLQWKAILNQSSSDQDQVELITSSGYMQIRWTWPVVP